MSSIRWLTRTVFGLGWLVLPSAGRAAPEEVSGTQAPESHAAAAAAPVPPDKWTDSQGNYYRRAKTGHVTSYDEAAIGRYTLPEVLVLQSGIPVRDAETWRRERRPELLELYRSQIYGRVPVNAPSVSFEVAEPAAPALDGLAIRKVIAVHFGDGGSGSVVMLHLYLPARAKEPVPVLLHLLFGKPPQLGEEGAPSSTAAKPSEVAPLADILARGYGYAVYKYTELEPDNGAADATAGVRALARAGSRSPRSGDDWGTISAWAWGASRMLDYLEKDPGVDARRVALIGHSRLGKTVLWAGAQDERFALIYSSCAGEIGSSLARRDYGETVDDMATNFSHQFAPNFEAYIRHWDTLPVDAHCLLALQAPRPLFLTGGTLDQWADPRGEFLAAVAAGPVYRLLGKTDLGTAEFPPPDTPVTTGELAFYYHAGPHAITPSDWKVFLGFADRYLKPTPH